MVKNWKTTTLGWVGAVGNLAIVAVQNGAVKPRDILLSIFLAALGSLAKDHNQL